MDLAGFAGGPWWPAAKAGAMLGCAGQDVDPSFPEE
jgi:hypothetical protein